MTRPPIIFGESVGQAGSRFYLITFVFHDQKIDF